MNQSSFSTTNCLSKLTRSSLLFKTVMWNKHNIYIIYIILYITMAELTCLLSHSVLSLSIVSRDLWQASTRWSTTCSVLPSSLFLLVSYNGHFNTWFFFNFLIYLDITVSVSHSQAICDGWQSGEKLMYKYSTSKLSVLRMLLKVWRFKARFKFSIELSKMSICKGSCVHIAKLWSRYVEHK